jgi:GTP-dependent phosphoenolpyruvate carboxykinase
MDKITRDAMSLMSWNKLKSMHRVIFRDVLGNTKGDLFWDGMNRRFQKLQKTLEKD